MATGATPGLGQYHEDVRVLGLGIAVVTSTSIGGRWNKGGGPKVPLAPRRRST
jgi:hypothetical protein